MNRRRIKLLGLILLSTLLLLAHPDRNAEAFWGCAQKEKTPARVIVIFVDMSASANRARRTVYNKAFEMIYQDLRQGDRVMVGTITSRSYIDFKPAVDVEIPKKSVWVNRIQFERNLAGTKEKIRMEVNRLLSKKQGTQRTEILNSLNIADTIFHDEKKRDKILVLLSDMIQDSKEYNFERSKLTKSYINKVVNYRQKNNLIPNLTGTKVYVAGASAADTNKYRSIENFWTIYFKKCGADFSHHRYGHTLISFEKGS
ncbi:MAG: hypothetical protein ABUJ92_06675 [Desulfobacterales bacterium]